MIIDLHMHTNTSPDTTQELSEMYKIAVQKGLKYICITNHQELNVHSQEEGYSLTSEKLAKYKNEFKDLVLNPITKIFFGVEMGYYQDQEEVIKQFIRENDFDFVIGSVHWVDNLEVANGNNREKFAVQTELHANLIDNYFLKLEKAIKCKQFDVVGHIDVFKKVMPEPDFFILKERWAKIADVLIENNVGFEINTSYKFSDKNGLHIYPSVDVLNFFIEKGIKTITIGSDAHSYNRIGDQVDEVEKLLKSLGVKQVCYFEKRKKYFVDL
ncbi:hypothetical protein COY27_04900 [Candidatus Woesearchaeota archaeon CG_4_10_14_0_2_um_filter_33_13]|nr:MAG: hypothetical protein COY27_04900 [Candidatus Woesearchaeota archaeon CG_4_10_14_0_2_um_filter_33_13]